MDNEYLHWVRETLGEFQTRLNLLHFEIDIQTPDRHGRKESGAAAATWVDESYLRAEIYLFHNLEEFYKEGQLDYCRKILLHELCHFFTNPIWEYASPGIPANAHPILTSLVERQTTAISNALWRAGFKNKEQEDESNS